MTVARAWVLSLAALACREPGPAEVFATDVVPILEARCTNPACHGVAPGAEASGDVIDRSAFYVDLDADGRISDPDAARQVAQRAIDPTEDPLFSSLLRKALPAAWGGLPHYGGVGFYAPDDPAALTVARWIRLETSGGESVPPLDPLEEQFATTVMPTLARRGCLTGSCHGLGTAIPFRLDPGVGGEFSTASLRDNAAAARRMLAPGAQPELARLLRKALPLHAGGIVHKGGNTSFQLADDEIAALLDWACAEREARAATTCDAADPGFVFVRGPLADHDPFTLDVFEPGTGLWIWRGGQATDLGVHDGTADARDPAVDPTGTRLVFSMRRVGEANHRIYLFDLPTGAIRALTAGGTGNDRDPTWGPDGEVWFVSDRAGTLADDGSRLDTELYAVSPDVVAEPTRWTWTPHIERHPTALITGEEAGGELAFTALRGVWADRAFAHPFRFPPDLATEYHQHFGITPTETRLDALRELADGRYVVVLGAVDDHAEDGELGIIDRNFGPEIQGDLDPALPFYADPIVRLGKRDGAIPSAPTAARSWARCETVSVS